jgi:hypothetical protein
MIRDVPVKVPEPEDFIAEYIFPSHIVVPRCSGEHCLTTNLKCNSIDKAKYSLGVSYTSLQLTHILCTYIIFNIYVVQLLMLGKNVIFYILLFIFHNILFYFSHSHNITDLPTNCKSRIHSHSMSQLVLQKFLCPAIS